MRIPEQDTSSSTSPNWNFHLWSTRSVLGRQQLPKQHGSSNFVGDDLHIPNLGGIISSHTFRSQDGPVYKLSLIVAGCFQAAFIMLGLATRQYWVWRHKQLDEGKVEHVEGMEQSTEYRYAI
jgi:hypothetical protein